MHIIIMSVKQNDRMEDKPARLTVLIDADRKKAFDELCAAQDITASQVVRQLIREYLQKHGWNGPGCCSAIPTEPGH
jgi:metal-responsive CopG/Arc/MetJ family transcriptional regulator